MTSDVSLRAVTEDDLPILFEQQCDPDAVYMAAFMGRDPADREAFIAHWTRIVGDESIITRTILYEGRVAGSIVKFEHDGKPEVGYLIGKPFWGKGIATRALIAFLGQVTARPLYAGVAKDNLASLRVLHKCGFTICGEGKGYSNVRGMEVEEYLLVLKASEPSERHERDAEP
jgi:RimJ/RimL family protein N-acetyltransferase